MQYAAKGVASFPGQHAIKASWPGNKATKGGVASKYMYGTHNMQPLCTAGSMHMTSSTYTVNTINIQPSMHCTVST